MTKEIMQNIFISISGLGLFLYGMKLMSDNLKKTVNNHLHLLLNKATSNRFFAVGIGLLITCIIQSSSATSILVISFVNAGLLNLFQGIGVIIGANVGTSITTSFVLFDLNIFAPLFIFIGSIIYLFSKVNKFKLLGLIILGFGILFFGIFIMSMGIAELSSNLDLESLIEKARNPFLAIIIGIILTSIIQSSTASIAILVTLPISFEIAAFLVLGINIGTCADTLIASLPANIESKRVAISDFLYNIITSILLALLIIFFPSILNFFENNWENINTQIIMFHCLYNIGSAIFIIPFIRQYTSFIEKLIPDKY